MGDDKTISAVDSPSTVSMSNPVPEKSRLIPQEASLGFSVAKVIAIFTVAAGHWFSGTILWIPVTFGLFVFAFSSAYFTSLIYGLKLDRKRFWRKKLERLGLRYWVCLSFLFVILGMEGRPIFHWHTLVHYLGLSGFLNWFAIPNRSALGGGLWFFTLLLLFYASYPYLAKMLQSKLAAVPTTIGATAAAVILESKIHVGHELWLTSLGFICGTAYGLHELRVSQRSMFVLASLFCLVLFGMNVFTTHKEFNTILIAAASIAISLWLAKAKFPEWRIAKRIAGLEKYLLEIFIIHTYLFIHLSGHPIPDFAISLLLIIMMAMALNRTSAWLLNRLYVTGLSIGTRPPQR